MEGIPVNDKDIEMKWPIWSLSTQIILLINQYYGWNSSFMQGVNGGIW